MSYTIEIISIANVRLAILNQHECNCRITRKINGEWSVSLMYFYIPGTEDKSQYLNLWKPRLRVKNNADTTDYQTFVLSRPEIKKRPDGVIEYNCYGDHYCIDKMKSEIINAERDFQDATPLQVLQYILDFSAITAGTATLSTKVSLKLSYETVMSALTKLIEAAKCEYQYIESTGVLNLVSTVGDSSKYINIKYGKNAKQISKKVLNYNVKNYIYGVGGGSPPATIAGARHIITAISTNTITLDSNKVVPENDVWNAYKVKFVNGTLAGNIYLITDSIHRATTDQLVLASSVAAASVGDSIVLLKVNNAELDYIKSSSSIAAREEVYDVYKNSQYGNLINLIKTSDFSGTYSSSICENWIEDGPLSAKAENTNETYIKYGTKSQSVTLSSSTQRIYQTVSVTPQRFYTLFANVYVVSGRATMSVLGTKLYSVSTAAGETGWQELKFEGINSGAETSVVIQFSSVSATVPSPSAYYIDSVALMESVRGADGSVESRSYVKSCEQTLLWYETFDYIMKVKDPVVEYSANFIDLYRLDPISYALDQIDIGDSVKVTDTDLGIVGAVARVTEMVFDPFRPENTEHTITTGQQ